MQKKCEVEKLPPNAKREINEGATTTKGKQMLFSSEDATEIAIEREKIKVSNLRKPKPKGQNQTPNKEYICYEIIPQNTDKVTIVSNKNIDSYPCFAFRKKKKKDSDNSVYDSICSHCKSIIKKNNLQLVQTDEGGQIIKIFKENSTMTINLCDSSCNTEDEQDKRHEDQTCPNKMNIQEFLDYDDENETSDILECSSNICCGLCDDNNNQYKANDFEYAHRNLSKYHEHCAESRCKGPELKRILPIVRGRKICCPCKRDGPTAHENFTGCNRQRSPKRLITSEKNIDQYIFSRRKSRCNSNPCFN